MIGRGDYRTVPIGITALDTWIQGDLRCTASIIALGKRLWGQGWWCREICYLGVISQDSVPWEALFKVTLDSRKHLRRLCWQWWKIWGNWSPDDCFEQTVGATIQVHLKTRNSGQWFWHTIQETKTCSNNHQLIVLGVLTPLHLFLFICDLLNVYTTSIY